MMLKIKYYLMVVFFFVSLVAAEEIKKTDDAKKSGKMEEVIVIATRTKQPFKYVLSSVTLIDREEIQKLQINDMASLLSKIPGLSVSSTGGNGSTLNVYMRGTNTNQTLVLLDGQRMSSATSGTSALQFIEPEQIQRVEVVRGAKASIYGSDAIGGVINIITRSDDSSENLFASVGGGTFATQKYSVAVHGEPSEGTHAQINVHYMESEGFDYTQTKAFGCGDKDGYENVGILSSIEQKFADWGTLTLGYLRNSGENEYDNPTGCLDSATSTSVACRPYQTFLLESYQISLEVQPSELWHSKLNFGIFKDESDNKDHWVSFTDSLFATTRDSAIWQNDFNWTSQQITTFAVDYYKDAVTVSGMEYIDRGNPVKDRDNIAYLIQHQANFLINEVQLAVRQDDNQSYGTKTTGDIAWGFNFDWLRLVLSYGTGFRAPSFNDLYYPYFGNPDLKPETSRQGEIDLSGMTQSFDWQLNFYYNRMKDMILNIEVTPGIYAPENVGKADIKGLELILGYRFNDIDLQAFYSYIDPVDKENDRTLPFRAKNLFNLDITKSFPLFDMGLTFSARSKSFGYDLSGGAHKMAGFATVDVFAAVDIRKKLTIKMKITNLLDQDYAVNQYTLPDGRVEDYNTAGIAGFVSLVYQMDF